MSLTGPSLKSTAPMVLGLTTQDRAFGDSSAVWNAFSTYWGSGGSIQSTLFFSVFSTGGNANLPATWGVYFDPDIDAFVPVSTGATRIKMTAKLIAQANASSPPPGEYVAGLLLATSSLPSQHDITALVQLAPGEADTPVQIYDRAVPLSGRGVMLTFSISDDGTNWVILASLDGATVGHGAPGTGFTSYGDNGTGFIVAPNSATAPSTFLMKVAANGNTYAVAINGTVQFSTTVPDLSTVSGAGFGFGLTAGALQLPNSTGFSTFKITTG